MADITTFYPGGNANTAVGHAGEADSIDNQNAADALLFWTGTQEQYDAIVASPPANHARTIYNVI